MKRTLSVIGCSVGGAAIGFFSDKLDTAMGGVLFAVGVLMLTVSAHATLKVNK